MFSLESPHRGDSNGHTQYTIFIIKTKNNLDYPKSAAMGFFLGTQQRVRNSRVNEPSVFEPLKFYSIIVFQFPLLPDCTYVYLHSCKLDLIFQGL